MPRAGGASSTLRLLDSLEYWIARRSLSSGGHSADPLAGDDAGGEQVHTAVAQIDIDLAQPLGHRAGLAADLLAVIATTA
jgi:hypothetical protein